MQEPRLTFGWAGALLSFPGESYRAAMGEPLLDLGGALFRRVSGDEWRRVVLVDGRYPVSVGLPLDDEWLEEFRLDGWRSGEPVYGSCGFSPRLP